MNALISVSDKTGVLDLARGLNALGIGIYATGGTERTLREAGTPVNSISDLTGFSELLDGRVKTLHANVHAGILARRDEPRHLRQLEERGLPLIDLVIVNLYPFVETAARAKDGDGRQVIEAIDIGGVALLRAAAKNHEQVLPVVRPSDYAELLARLEQPERIDLPFRRRLAALAFAHTAAYDAAIAAHFEGGLPQPLPSDFALGGRKVRDLRYGENPHQAAAIYSGSRDGGIVGARQWQGLEPSYNNLLDGQAAWALVSELDEPAAVIVKHANPCGVGLGSDPADAYARAHACDPRSAFGGIVGLNRMVDAQAAARLKETFLEVVVAPGFDEEARVLLAARPKLRLLEPGPGPAAPGYEARAISGGFLVQSADNRGGSLGEARVVTRTSPDAATWAELQLAWTVVKHVRSNAITLVRDRAAVGIGAGQMSRVEAVELAVRRAGERAQGSVMASDGFFPYPDGVEVAARADVRAIVQPGGSVKDPEVIAAADEAGIAMVFTGERHFRH
jgi:phosphoribosylaminoimidazolecarboxamide formyltransferase/IMP cyclohydrolase